MKNIIENNYKCILKFLLLRKQEVNTMPVASEKERGKGVGFSRIRRITGYITGDLSTWNDAKKEEESQRVKHA